MSFQKSQTNITFLLSLTILGLVYSQISVPLKSNSLGQLYFSAIFGQQCITDIAIVNTECQELEIFKTDLKCLSNSTSDNDASFIFGKTLSNLSYKSVFYNSQLYIGFNQTKSQNTTLSQLVSQKLINRQIIYINLINSFQTKGYGDIVGEANFGSPNYNYIKKGANLVQLKKAHHNTELYIVQNKGLKFFGKQLESKNVIFTLDDDHYFTQNAFLQMVQILEKQGIPHTFQRNDGYQVYRVYLTDITKLQPIELFLTLEDNTTFNLTLQVSQYVRQHYDGTFQLAIQANFYQNYMKIGKNALKTHYIGFDQSNGTVQIAEK